MRKIKNYCFFHIKGLNQERFFTDLSKTFFVFDINRYEKNKSTFKVSLKDYKHVKSKILSAGFEILGQKKVGFLHNLFSIRKRYGLLAGIFLFTIFYAFQYNLIWRISVDGVSEKLDEQICAYVASQFSKNKKDLNCKEIEIKLQEEFEELSFASVSIYGQTLMINVKERENPAEKEGEFNAIVSKYDCKILDIQLLQGTLNVDCGKVVQRGEELVLPYVIDTNGVKRSVQPKAVFLIEQWIQGEEIHYEKEVVKERTGRICVTNEITLFGQCIYSNKENCDFENFEIEEEVFPFSKNNILPFVFHKTTAYEVKHVQKEEKYEVARENKIASAHQKALQKIEDCDIIKEERIEETNNAGVYKIVYTLTIQKEMAFK